ncbi:MAG: ABC transporter permease [Lentisphaerae bacterium]|nr:ABC transporter permease [Lentisphaerota bacterium]
MNDPTDNQIPQPAPSATEECPEETLYMASQWRLMWLKFKDHRLAHVSLYVVIIMYLIGAFCEIVAPHAPHRRNAKGKYVPPQRIRLLDQGRPRLPFVYALERHKDPETLALTYTLDYERPIGLRLFAKGDPYRLWGVIPMQRHLIGASNGGRIYLMGGDKLGRCVFSRIIYGSRISLSIGLIGVVLSLGIGIALGGISGYYGGIVDTLIQRIIEVLRSFPTIPLWLALSAAMPATWGQLRVYFCMTLILAFIGWTGVARVVRGKILALREEDYAMAARVAGVREFNIIIRHLVPGFTSHLIVTMTIAIPRMILAETSLSFLRLGLRPPTISWGVLLQDAQNVNAIALYPWLMYPVVFVIIAVLMFNFLGDGLRDAADPYRN